jgi:chemotaxis protein MotB
MSLKNQKNRYRSNEGGEGEGNLDEWLLTYSDMITLLLAFFLLLISVSEVDMALFEQLKSGLRSEIMKEEKVRTPLAEIKHDLDSLLATEREKQLVHIDLGKDGIQMEFASSAFYAPGSADVGEEAQRIIRKVSLAVKKIDYYPFRLEVEGHTDNVPINTPRFPSNWELSSARATNIVKYLIDQSLDPNRLKAAGYADTRPLAPNQDSSGVALKENQAKNRRILMRIW